MICQFSSYIDLSNVNINVNKFFIDTCFCQYMFNAHTQSVTLTRCNFMESVAWFGWYMSFGQDNVISVLMMSFWIFIDDFLGSMLFIWWPLVCQPYKLVIAQGTQKHKTCNNDVIRQWALSHQHFLVKFLQYHAHRTLLIFILIQMDVKSNITKIDEIDLYW